MGWVKGSDRNFERYAGERKSQCVRVEKIFFFMKHVKKVG